MKGLLLAFGAALSLALGGIGVTNLAAGADHSGSGRHHAPAPAERGESSEHGKPSRPGRAGAQHSNQMSDFAQTHRAGMRAWQQCHEAGGTSCQKPSPPGWLKHPEKHPGGWPPKMGNEQGRARGEEKNDHQGERD